MDWNQKGCIPSGIFDVTSLAEVWIEILLFLNKFCQSSVTSLAEVWIEISFLVVAVADAVRHFPCGSVDWNLYLLITARISAASLPLRKCGLKFYSILIWVTEWCHFPCGSVDWNRYGRSCKRGWGKSLPLRKCGLKCQKGRSTGRNTRSLPLRKCGLKWSSIQILNSVISVTSLAEVWIEID